MLIVTVALQARPREKVSENERLLNIMLYVAASGQSQYRLILRS